MWLSERAANGGTHRGASARVGKVTLGGANASVLLSGESRELQLLTPGGIYWQPEADTQVMVLETDDGERFILGEAAAGRNLNDGELVLHCGETVLKLGRDGVRITGRLFLNGTEITAEE